MSLSGTGVRIFDYYHKRIRSLRSHLAKSIHSLDFHEIHSCRVDLKKLFALFQLFELLDKKGIRTSGLPGLYKRIFNSLGSLRELQVSNRFIEQYGIRSEETSALTDFLRKKEKKAISRFYREALLFKESIKDADNRVIRKICADIDRKEIKAISRQYIREKGRKIKKLASAGHEPEQLHKIRKHLKAAGSIVLLRKTVISAKDPLQLSGSIHRAEVLIGKWHDKVLFEAGLKKYLIRKYHENASFPGSLTDLVTSVNKESDELGRLIWNEMDNVINNILLL